MYLFETFFFSTFKLFYKNVSKLLIKFQNSVLDKLALILLRDFFLWSKILTKTIFQNEKDFLVILKNCFGQNKNCA